jgi:hypothetical protein
MLSSLRDRAIKVMASPADYGSFATDSARMFEINRLTRDLLTLLNDGGVSPDTKYMIRNQFQSNIPQINYNEKDLNLLRFAPNSDPGELGSSILSVIDKIIESDNNDQFRIPSSNSIHIQGNVTHSQIQQGTIKSTQNYTSADSQFLLRAFEKLQDDLQKENLAEEKLEAINANLAIIQTQIKLPSEHQDPQLSKRAWEYLSNVSTVISLADFCNQNRETISTLLRMVF